MSEGSLEQSSKPVTPANIESGKPSVPQAKSGWVDLGAKPPQPKRHPLVEEGLRADAEERNAKEQKILESLPEAERRRRELQRAVGVTQQVGKRKHTSGLGSWQKQDIEYSGGNED